VIDIPEEMKEEVSEYRANLIEAVAEYDEALMEKFLKMRTPSLKTKFTQP
jgi:elongation factor G